MAATRRAVLGAVFLVVVAALLVARGAFERIASAQRAAGVTQVLSYQLGQGSIYITNNVPYIDRLNNGWSQQSPAGFVDKAVQVAVTNFRARR